MNRKIEPLERAQCDRPLTLALSVHCVVFAFDGDQLRTLFTKLNVNSKKAAWSTVGECVGHKETIDQAATGLLKEISNGSEFYLEQLHWVDSSVRNAACRVVSMVYFALIRVDEFDKRASGDAEFQWFPLDQIPKLVQFHSPMVEAARLRLKQSGMSHSNWFELLPRKFTLRQLQRLYENIYNIPLDTRNFVKKIFSLNIITRLSEKDSQGSRKGAYYYTLKRSAEKTNRLLWELSRSMKPEN